MVVVYVCTSPLSVSSDIYIFSNTGEDETELVNEVKSDGESDYFLKPPDYDTDDENYITPGEILITVVLGFFKE
jgi:PleD family two-component response regulator